MKIFKLSLIVLSIAFMLSCSKESDTVSADFISGKWQITNVNIVLKSASEDPVNFNESFVDNKYFFILNADGTYSVSVDEATILKFEKLGDGNPIGFEEKGTYEIKDGQIKFIAKQSGETVISQFKFVKTDNDNISFEMDKALYFVLVRAELEKNAAIFTSLGVSVNDLIKELEADITEFKYVQKLKRVK